jgi:predicted SprT family Zn-dependent metalloprotease
VIFHAALECSHKALVGLIAHEIAHGFVTQSDSRTDEKETDLQAIRWGFAEELEALQVAKDLQ